MMNENIAYIQLDLALNREDVMLHELTAAFMELLASAGLPTQIEKFKKVTVAYEKIKQLAEEKNESFLFNQVKQTFALLILNALGEDEMTRLI